MKMERQSQSKIASAHAGNALFPYEQKRFLYQKVLLLPLVQIKV